jgi:3-phenylpropionate/trans-cinnamate dioxygenase ferredoxin subunit
VTWLKVCELDQLTEGHGLAVEVTDDLTVALFSVDGSVYAIDNRCSHAEASLSEGEVFDCEVECPRHGAAFNLSTGEPQSLPATVPVDTYEVRVETGSVSINLENTHG